MAKASRATPKGDLLVTLMPHCRPADKAKTVVFYRALPTPFLFRKNSSIVKR